MRKRIKKLLAAVLVAVTLLSLASCKTDEMQSETWYDLFDTYVTVMSTDTREGFRENSKKIKDALTECSMLFDIYREYEGYNNLSTVNKNAGVSPVVVDERILSLVEYGVEMHALTGGEVNIAMGAVLSLWHDAREAADGGEGALPDEAALTEASAHTDIKKIKIDREAKTLYLEDSEMSLDVGAIAKGFAADYVARILREAGVDTGYALNLGGNVAVIGERREGEAWRVSVQSPDSQGGRIAVVGARDKSLVTSGVYERYFTVGGVRYHHIIDTDTLYPSVHFDGVSVIGEKSALCDALSTALFCMSLEDGQALVESIDGVEALWIVNGEIYKSSGFPDDIDDIKED